MMVNKERFLYRASSRTR